MYSRAAGSLEYGADSARQMLSSIQDQSHLIWCNHSSRSMVIDQKQSVLLVVPRTSRVKLKLAEN